MAGKPERHRGLVFKKTRLGETDLIVAFLTVDGSRLDAVARGARKPQNPFASRLELFSIVDLWIVRGRNLPIVTDVKLIESHQMLRRSLEASYAAAPVLELASTLAQPNEPVFHWFDAANVALDMFDEVAQDIEANHEAPSDDQKALLLSLCSGILLKSLAFLGFRPALDACASCGRPLFFSDNRRLRWCPSEGGVLCEQCPGVNETRRVPASLLQWAHGLLYQRFDDYRHSHPSLSESLDILKLIQDLITTHLGYPLRSIQSLKESSLFL